VETAIRHVCSGCGYVVPEAEDHPFLCPRSGDGTDVDHVLRRELETARLPPREELARVFQSAEPNPFLRFRRLLWSYHAARARGLGDARYVEIVKRLDEAIAEVDGSGFRSTRFERSAELAEALGVSALWIKDETENVAGSHKARHLMGLMIWLEVLRELGGVDEPAPLAIASCGNAARAAAVVARAASRRLRVFVPENAGAGLMKVFERLGAETEVCARTAGIAGDPSVRRFRAALARGALPFTCQGPENGLVIEGGESLAFEMLAVLLAQGRRLDRIVVQVGGGALATAVARAFAEALELRLIDRLPRLSTVQSEGAAPLARAYGLVAARVAARMGASVEGAVAPEIVDDALGFAASHRSQFMWPWEEEPRSIATGILDDETYDWQAVVRAMLVSGGRPLVVSEKTLARANELARRATGIAVSPTGSAGLAGCLALRESAELEAGEETSVLFTGVARRPS
jgi:threonine synthase